MRVVVQRVTGARVRVGPDVVGDIGRGLLVLVGVSRSDEARDVEYLAGKIAHLRVFEDDEGRMNRSVIDAGGEVLLVSQFTLYGDCRKGRRPSFDHAAEPERARVVYEQLAEALRGQGLRVATGVFRASMAVELVNDGPVTILMDSARAF